MVNKHRFQSMTGQHGYFFFFFFFHLFLVAWRRVGEELNIKLGLQFDRNLLGRARTGKLFVRSHYNDGS